MRKLILLSLVLLMITPMLLMAEGAAESQQQQMTFKWSIGLPAAHPMCVSKVKTAEEIFRKTNGAIKIDVMTDSILGSEKEATDQIRAGSILGGTIGGQMFENYYTDLSGLRFPFTFSSAREAQRYFKGYAKDNIWNKPVRQATSIYFLAGQNIGMRHLTTKGIAVKKPEDLKGIRIRSMEQPVSIASVEALGAVAVPIASSELFMALQTGVATGQENPISNIHAQKFYEVQDYVILTGHTAGTAVDCVNEKVWNTIPAKYRAIIEAEFVASCDKVTEDALAAEDSLLLDLKNRGMKVLTQADIDYAAFVASGQKIIEQKFSDPKYDGAKKLQREAMNWLKANPK